MNRGQARARRHLRVGPLLIAALIALSFTMPVAAGASRRANARPAGDDALAAVLQWSDVQRLLADGSDFWPTLPTFQTGLDPTAKVQPLVEVYQQYQ